MENEANLEHPDIFACMLIMLYQFLIIVSTQRSRSRSSSVSDFHSLNETTQGKFCCSL